MSERIKEVSLVDRINDLLSSSILRLHGPNKNHDDCFHCQLIIDLKKIRQALTTKDEELRKAEAENAKLQDSSLQFMSGETEIQKENKELREKVAKARNALYAADKFISNGIDLGFIRMPDDDCPDPAKLTPGIVKEALTALKPKC